MAGGGAHASKVLDDDEPALSTGELAHEKRWSRGGGCGVRACREDNCQKGHPEEPSHGSVDSKNRDVQNPRQRGDRSHEIAE